jgi:hypothetical protein
MYDPVTASLYSCICPAVTEGKKIDLGEALATVNEELKNRQKRSQLKKTPVHDVVRLK